MKVTALFFAQVRERAGRASVELSLPEGSRLADALAALAREHAALGPLWPQLAVAVNGKLARPETPLEDGAELALLPPVSGGAEVAELVDGPIEVECLLAAATRPDRGAVVLFLGTTRDHHEGRQVLRLEYEAYRPMALAALERIERDTVERHGVATCRIVHRLGVVPVAEASVAVVVAAVHRSEAFDATRWAMDQVKSVAPIWKKEHYAGGGAAWVVGKRLE